jgi:hypothetical protein
VNRRAQISNADEIHPGDFFDETDEDSFFIKGGARQMSCQEQLSTLLNTDEGVVFLVHLARECTAHYAWIDSVMHYRHMYPRMVQLPLTIKRGRFQFIEASNLDAMLGRTADLQDRIQNALRDERTRILVVVSSCIAEITGIDLRGMLEEEASKSPIPVVFLEWTVDENTLISRFWEGMLQLVRRDARPLEGVVNLVGYAAEDSAFAREAENLLDSFGLRVNGWFIPSYRTDAAEVFLSAACTLINSAGVAELEFALARKNLPQMRYLDQEPPFGPTATRDFYRRVLKGCGQYASADSLDQAWEPYAGSFEKWRRRASEHTVAVLVRPGEERFLMRPDTLYGIDLARLVREMGFRLSIHYLGDENRGQQIKRHLLSELVADPGVEVQAVGEIAEPISRYIESIDASLVFTEFPPDLRITDAGKMFFHPRDLELGFGGAVRSIARLTRLAESRFHRAFNQAYPRKLDR